MTKQEYLFIKLISGGEWFDWHKIRYTTRDFELWHKQGFMERAADMHYSVRDKQGLSVGDWRLTPQAHNLLGVTDDQDI